MSQKKGAIFAPNRIKKIGVSSIILLLRQGIKNGAQRKNTPKSPQNATPKWLFGSHRETDIFPPKCSRRKFDLYLAITLNVSMDYITCRCDDPQGKLYQAELSLADNPELSKFIEMCFDFDSSINEQKWFRLPRSSLTGANGNIPESVPEWYAEYCSADLSVGYRIDIDQ